MCTDHVRMRVTMVKSTQNHILSNSAIHQIPYYISSTSKEYRTTSLYYYDMESLPSLSPRTCLKTPCILCLYTMEREGKKNKTKKDF